MLIVMLAIIFLTADVFLASPEMHSLPVRELQLHQLLQRLLIPAFLLRVDQMQFVMQKVELLPVNV